MPNKNAANRSIAGASTTKNGGGAKNRKWWQKEEKEESDGWGVIIVQDQLFIRATDQVYSDTQKLKRATGLSAATVLPNQQYCLWNRRAILASWNAKWNRIVFINRLAWASEQYDLTASLANHEKGSSGQKEKEWRRCWLTQDLTLREANGVDDPVRANDKRRDRLSAFQRIGRSKTF